MSKPEEQHMAKYEQEQQATGWLGICSVCGIDMGEDGDECFHMQQEEEEDEREDTDED